MPNTGTISCRRKNHSMTTDAAITEQDIAELVHRFYDRARQDAMLGPIFADAIKDWGEHLSRNVDFWSSSLLGTGRYRGNPFMLHAVLPLEPEQFDRWLDLFRETAEAVLPAPYAAKALAKAAHMSESIKAGMFTVPGHRFGMTR